MAKSIDIETIPNETMIPFLPEPEVATGNLKDPEKIATKIEVAERSQIEKMALSPLTGRICSYAVCDEDDSNNGYKVINSINDEMEACLITDIFNELTIGKKFEASVIITWNGNNFDLPFIYKRSAILGIKLPKNSPPLSYWTKRYTNVPHCDLMQVWSNWGAFDGAHLGWVSEVVLKEKKIDVDVTKFLEMLNNGEGEKIGKYNLQDAILTMKLYRHLNNYFF